MPLTAKEHEDLQLVIEELQSLFNEAESDGREHIDLRSAVGARFHRRVERSYQVLSRLEAEFANALRESDETEG